ncbi:MAG: hypothetical protein J7623_28085 [Chitinophaga sp.]|uniref:hypothetical protein n=1 Tax=Chitinophaga sp. TaxID=1869181 RepID=UPI001B20FF06|nr:hypothetical protein [Chitinophaga sp.]MBO9732535.1 hypothetical protein [Chitinophaga sp.]
MILFFKEMGVSVAPFDMNGDQIEDVLFDCSGIKGDFCTQLFVYTKMVFDVRYLADLICKALKTEVLIADNSLNPFSWILITEKEERIVYQRIEDNDENLFLIVKN